MSTEQSTAPVVESNVEQTQQNETSSIVDKVEETAHKLSTEIKKDAEAVKEEAKKISSKVTSETEKSGNPVKKFFKKISSFF
ncbi:hypothetical protein C6P40_001263 [Pichia californica]|uniref:Uncharacterized protein n=1 Tax=Pichia californica TaxID=460514 RepID=A0A9P7BG17_9ASCO|nr:hypothetical protein C6P42_001301 [[Candida] californica]KAG0688234.1 hypothetical protein C6P40_001263 [[Candida] californica]